MEQLFNLYSSTLASAYTAGSGIIHVASGSGLPSAGVFALTVLDQSTFVVKVIFRGHYLGGTAIAVTAEGSDVSAASGDIVVGSQLTTRSLVAILEDWLGYGPTVNLPSVTGRSLGQRFKVNDGVFEYVLDDGTLSSPASGSPAYIPYIKGIKTAIPNQSFSWINQGSATVATQPDGSILLTGSSSASASLQCRVFTAPATPYKYKFVFTPILPDGTFPHCGLLWTDGTKVQEVDLLYDSGNNIHFTGGNYNSPTSFNGAVTLTPSGGYPFPSGQVLVMGISDDGVNRKIFWYPDGYAELTLFSVARATFVTPTELGFFYDDNGASKGGAILVHGIDRLI